MDFDLEKLWREGGGRWERLTTREIAVELGTTVGALYRWARLGKIPGLTREFLDARRRLDPLREVDRAEFEPGSGPIEYAYSWKKDVLRKLKRFDSSEDLIESGFIRGRHGRFQDYVSIRVRDRLAFYVGTTPIAFLDCQRTWFVVEYEDEDAAHLADEIDIVADYIEGCHEEPYRIRPSLYFLNVEAAEDGLQHRSEIDPSAPAPGKAEARMSFEMLKDLADEPWSWPPDAGETIVGVLLDARAASADRLLAAQFAGEFTVIDDEVVEALLAVLRDDAEAAPLRSRAAISLGPVLEEADLGEFDDDPVDSPLTPATFDMLREALRTVFRDAGVPAEVRRAILEAAVRSPQDWQREAILTAWASGDPDWTRTAVFCMGFIKGFEDPILAALEGGRPDLRYEAVRAAGNWQLDAAWEHIVPLITRETPDVADKPLLLAAIEAASAIRPVEASELLMDLMETEDEDVLEAIEEALAMAEACG